MNARYQCGCSCGWTRTATDRHGLILQDDDETTAEGSQIAGEGERFGPEWIEPASLAPRPRPVPAAPRTCAAVAVACLGVAAAGPAPVVVGLALILLLAVPWGLAIAHRLASRAGSASE